MVDTQKKSPQTLFEKIILFGAVGWFLITTIPPDIARGIYHIIRCELVADEWSWETYEATIGDDTYEFKRCERCKWDRRVPAAYMEV